MTSSESTPLLTQQPSQINPPTYHTDEETTTSSNAPNPSTFARNLSALDGFALLISIVIGSGIFSSPGPVDANTPSPGSALLIWALGGILAWTGALTLAELGTALPGEGGVQGYLTYVYGDVVGYMAAWSWIVATMPATLAILGIVFVESVYSSLGVNEPSLPITHRLMSCGVVVVVMLANSISTRTSTRLSGFFVGVKILTVFLLILAGAVVVGVYIGKWEDWGGGDWRRKRWFDRRDTVLSGGRRVDWGEVGVWEALGFYSTALYGALWAYSGWDKANYVAAELRNPTRQLPLSINTAIPTIILCYIAANTVYYILLPWSVVSTTDAAAVTAISHFLGPTAAYLATSLICLVILGSLLGNSFVAGRMTVAASNKSWIPRIFGSVGHIANVKISKASPDDTDAEDAMQQGESPINALILNAVLSSVYILLGNMRILLTLNGLAEYAFFFLTVLGAIILRFREPELARPVKPFIGIPIVFALISGFVVVRGAVFAPVQAAILLGIWAVGVVFYYGRLFVLARGGGDE